MDSADHVLLLLWPHGDTRPHLDALPQPATIEVSVGPLTKGDLEDRPYPAYAAYNVDPRVDPAAPAEARFGDALALVDHQVSVDDAGGARTYTFRLWWRAEAEPPADYTAFVYLCNERCTADGLLVQDDAQPGTPFYPTSLWRPQDVVVDTRTLDLPPTAPPNPTVGVGLYAWPTLERLTITEPPGPWLDDVLLLPSDD
jgi:hypothetical protein